MFKLQVDPTFKAKVMIPVPGKPSVPVEIEYRHKTKSDLLVYLERAGRARGAEEADVLHEVIAGWSGIDREYSRDALAELIDVLGGAGGALLMAYSKELTDARLGN
jgi:hypothetical protein